VDLRTGALSPAVRRQAAALPARTFRRPRGVHPRQFPIFDTFQQNAYVIADSNHGYKMLGVGDLVAGELLGEPSTLLEPFRFARYRTGRLHPVSNSPFPWS
jgi:hypothetical protein